MGGVLGAVDGAIEKLGAVVGVVLGAADGGHPVRGQPSKEVASAPCPFQLKHTSAASSPKQSYPMLITLSGMTTVVSA